MYLVWGCMWPTIQNEFDIPGIDFQVSSLTENNVKC